MSRQPVNIPSKNVGVVKYIPAGKHEVNFDSGLAQQQSSTATKAGDADGNNQLDFDEFCELIKRLEPGEHTVRGLRARFDALDGDGSGLVDISEYMKFALYDAMSRLAARGVTSEPWEWDDDGSGTISKKEFVRAVKAHGFDYVEEKDIVKVFDELDMDGNGTISKEEIQRKVREYAGMQTDQRHQIRSSAAMGKQLVFGKEINLDASTSILDQLRQLIAASQSKVLDLFRLWDENGDGTISRAEFRGALTELGLKGERPQIDALFGHMDTDGSGAIEFKELRRKLQPRDAGPSLSGGQQAAFALELADDVDPRVLSSSFGYAEPDPRQILEAANTEGTTSISKNWSYYKHNWSSGKSAPREPYWSDLDHTPATRRSILQLDRPDLRRLSQNHIARKVEQADELEQLRMQRLMTRRSQRLLRTQEQHLDTREDMMRLGVVPPAHRYGALITSPGAPGGRILRNHNELSSIAPAAHKPLQGSSSSTLARSWDIAAVAYSVPTADEIAAQASGSLPELESFQPRVGLGSFI